MSTASPRRRWTLVVVTAVTSFLLGAATTWTVAAAKQQMEDVYVERICSVGEEPVWHTENVSGSDCTRNGRVLPGYARYPAGRVPTWSVAPEDYDNLDSDYQDAYDVHPNRPDYPYLDDLLATYPERGCAGVPLQTVRRVSVGPGTLHATVNPAGDLCLRLTAPGSAETRVEARQHGVRWVQEGAGTSEPLRVGTRGLVRVTASVSPGGDQPAEVFSGRVRVGVR